MKTLLVLIAGFSLLFFSDIFAQYSFETELIEPDMVTLSPPQQPGGRYITSIAKDGQFVRVLIVFVQFADDDWETGWGEWEVGSPPSGWMNLNIIDQFTFQNTTTQNLTHYYTTMSLEQYKVIGYTYHKITTNTRAEYISMGYDRGDINRQILQQMDSYINFSSYDIWKKLGEFDHDWGTDDEVDMIWMVYRNIDNDLPNPGYTAWQLGFGNRGLLMGNGYIEGGQAKHHWVEVEYYGLMEDRELLI